MSFLANIFRSKSLYLNLVAILILIIVLYIALNAYLNSYTMHGKTVTIPNLIGMQPEEAIDYIEKNDFRFKIIDTICDSRYEKGTVVDQDPKPDAPVKKGRRIYITINSNDDELISMPQLVGNSMRQANLIAETYGIYIGDISYAPDIATNVVIKQFFNNEEIEANTKIKKHSKIDLVLGLGLSDEKTNIPLLIGLTYKEANLKLLESYLNTGLIEYDSEVKTRQDSLNARVYRQNPNFSTINLVNLGYNVDIWLTNDMELVDESKEEVNNTIELEKDLLEVEDE